MIVFKTMEKKKKIEFFVQILIILSVLLLSVSCRFFQNLNPDTYMKKSTFIILQDQRKTEKI